MIVLRTILSITLGFYSKIRQACSGAAAERGIISTLRQASMIKKLLLLLIALLLTACSSPATQPPQLPPAFLPSSTPLPTARLPRFTSTQTLAFTATPAIPTQTLGSSATEVSSLCYAAAVLLRDVTIPDGAQLKAGESFLKTWELQNSGTCPWSGYTVEFSSGDAIGAPQSLPVPETAPGASVLLSMELTAPSADGTYTAHFLLRSAFGEAIPIGAEKTFWVSFIVGAPARPTAIPPKKAPAANCVQYADASVADAVLALINAERAKAGLPAYIYNAEIAAFALAHSEDMAYNNFLSHDGTDGTFGERMAAYNMAHPTARLFGEILAIGTPQNAMQQWSRDEHWDMVLSGNTQAGAGYVYSSCSDYGGYITVNFGN